MPEAAAADLQRGAVAVDDRNAFAANNLADYGQRHIEFGGEAQKVGDRIGRRRQQQFVIIAAG